MPEYGGYFAPVSDFLPDSSQTPNAFHRSNLAVMFLADVVVAGLESKNGGSAVDWWVHLPTMLHMIFLGLDHSRPLVVDHCKQLLLNLLMVLGCHGDHFTVGRISLNAGTKDKDYGLSTPSLLPSCLKLVFTGKVFLYYFLLVLYFINKRIHSLICNPENEAPNTLLHVHN
jgi:hypothetical protein